MTRRELEALAWSQFLAAGIAAGRHTNVALRDADGALEELRKRFPRPRCPERMQGSHGLEQCTRTADHDGDCRYSPVKP